jgi:hypothetical protein
MCVQCRERGEDIEWDHWCIDCLGFYPFNHKRAPGWKILLRKIARLLSGRFQVKVYWE